MTYGENRLSYLIYTLCLRSLTGSRPPPQIFFLTDPQVWNFFHVFRPPPGGTGFLERYSSVEKSSTPLTLFELARLLIGFSISLQSP